MTRDVLRGKGARITLRPPELISISESKIPRAYRIDMTSKVEDLWYAKNEMTVRYSLRRFFTEPFAEFHHPFLMTRWTEEGPMSSPGTDTVPHQEEGFPFWMSSSTLAACPWAFTFG